MGKSHGKGTFENRQGNERKILRSVLGNRIVRLGDGCNLLKIESAGRIAN
jgi:hypothetical protein